jgi:hypothetical protein
VSGVPPLAAAFSAVFLILVLLAVTSLAAYCKEKVSGAELSRRYSAAE